MLSLCLTFLGFYISTDMKKIDSNVAAKFKYFFSDFYSFINVVKRETIALVSLTNAYYFSELIKLKTFIS